LATAKVCAFAAGGTRWGAHGGAVVPSGRLRCDARPGVVSPNSLRSLRSLRSDRRRQVRQRSALRAPTPVLRFSPPHKSPPANTACCDVNPRWRAPQELLLSRPRCLGAGCGAPLRRRGAQGSWPRAQRVRDLTCRRLFERSERSERSEFGDGPRDRVLSPDTNSPCGLFVPGEGTGPLAQSQGSRRAATTAEAKRRSPPPGALAAHASTRGKDRRHV